jgi:hypothetical protein
MTVWWKRLSRSKVVETTALQFMKMHGDRAYEVARKAARSARNKRRYRQARHYSYVALSISELTKREVGLDTVAQMAEQRSIAPN